MSEHPSRFEAMLRRVGAGVSVVSLGALGLAACSNEQECGGVATASEIATMPFGDGLSLYVANQPDSGQVIVFKPQPDFGKKVYVFTEDEPSQLGDRYAYNVDGIGTPEVTITCAAIENNPKT